MNAAPVRAERVPVASVPVRLPEVRMTRATFLVNVVTGGVLAVLGLAAAVRGLWLVFA